MRATAIRDENQAVTAPAPWPIAVTVPVRSAGAAGSTVATDSSVEANRAQRVTSREEPSE